MDPVSVAASVIAIATVAAQVTTAFAELRKDSVELPGRLHALSNEVADIEFVLYQVAAVLQERNCLSDDDKQSIPALLGQADAKLKQLKNILDRLAGLCTRRRVLLRASVWRKWLPKLQELQADIRGIKCSLNVLLGASNSRDLIRVRLELETLSRTSSRESEDKADLRLHLSKDIAQSHATLEHTVSENIQKVDQRIRKIEELLMAQAVVIDDSQYPGTVPKTQSTAVAMRQYPRAAASSSNSEKSGSTSQAVGIRVKKNLGPVCRPGCSCICHSERGDIDGLKGLFQHGMASPKDVSSTRGYSLLRWALYGQQYETCRFLLAAGSDPDYRPIAISDDSPADKACDVLLRGHLSTGVIEILRCISRDSEFIEDQDFAPIHRIVLELSLQDLETEILRDPKNVDVRDAMGRTALEWAAARGDDRAVITLLSFGAEPNIVDKKLNTPLTLASNQGHTLCVRLLLEAGALSNPITPLGVKFGSPLSCAARNANDPLLLKTLLDFDADVEASGVDGVTPLLHVARGKPVSFAKLLLDYGADINAMSKDGRTALTTAIIYNNHSVLHLLLDRWFEYTECPRLKGPHLLDLVIDHADIETMTILTTAKHLQIHGDNGYVIGRFSPQLHMRHDLTDAMVAAFERLLDAIREPPKRSMDCQSSEHSGRLSLERLSEPFEEDVESLEEYEDAQESFSLASDDLSTIIRHRQGLRPVEAGVAGGSDG